MKKTLLVLAISASILVGCGSESSAEAEEVPSKQYSVFLEEILVNGRVVPCIVADRSAYKGGVAITCNWNENSR
jgi:hypothetical protein